MRSIKLKIGELERIDLALQLGMSALRERGKHYNIKIEQLKRLRIKMRAAKEVFIFVDKFGNTEV